MKKNKNMFVAFGMILALIGITTLFFEGARIFGSNPTCLASSIDDKIPFLTVFIYPYISWYVMLAIIPMIMYIAKPQNMYKYAATCIISVLIAFVIFALFPTTVNRPEVTGTDITSCITRLIFNMDTPPLCCLPSMHCALCFMFILYTIDIKEIKPSIKLVITLWSIIVMMSTLYIKQHVIYDVILALPLVILSHIICVKFKLYTYIEVLHDKLCQKFSKD